jgi:hypothetical protein
MAEHANKPSPPAITYTAQAPLHGVTLTCNRCTRVHPFPESGGKPARCECGWWYSNDNGLIQEEFKPRLGV